MITIRETNDDIPEPYNCEMLLNEGVEKIMRETLEIEFLQGERVILDSGQIRIRLTLSNKKIRKFKKAIHRAMGIQEAKR